MNPDAGGYIKAAYWYSNLDFNKAINGYWAPMISWLLVPFIKLNIDPYFSFHLLNSFISIAILLIVIIVSIRSSKNINSIYSTVIKSFFIISFGLTMIVWSQSVLTPDFLSAFINLLLFLFLIRFVKKTPSIKLSISIGLLMAMLYFSKSVGLYVSIIYIILLSFYILRLKHNKKIYIKRLVLILSIFSVLCLIWISLISVKYNTFTISTSGKINLALIGPNNRMSHRINYNNVMFSLKHKDSSYAWDDPSYLQLDSWSIKDNTRYFINNIIRTSRNVLDILFTSSPLFLISLILIVVFNRNKKINMLMIAFSIPLFIYGMVYVEQRYLWMVIIPIIVYGACFIDKIKYNKPILFVLFSFIVFLSIINTYDYYNNNKSALARASNSISVREELKNDDIIPKYSNIILGSNNMSLYHFCVVNKYRCIGQYDFTTQIQENIKTIKQNKSKYYLSLDDHPVKSKYLDLIKVYRPKNTYCIDKYFNKYECGSKNSIYVYKIKY